MDPRGRLAGCTRTSSGYSISFQTFEHDARCEVLPIARQFCPFRAGLVTIFSWLGVDAVLICSLLSVLVACFEFFVDV